ncbi:hypothetical protein MHT86_04135 [Corynebacterium mastitidis]|uniref:Uncharacterized protein n=1 Tax=Corynebacterium mastitidis TaxID=161890 RepID=A0A2N0X4S8_9CORY|nr:hypothetical protein [Corynebacterium mastitidis]MCH6196689.1 hypothetical protein [Corynebacterium mastitidis]PKF67704.1 hypothetical protein CXB45_10890 [Corynebacterium mastitidis]
MLSLTLAFTEGWNWDLVWRGVQAAVSLLGFAGLVWGIRLNTQAHVHRAAADNRAEWWRRFVWAVDKTREECDQMRILGCGALADLSTSELITTTELYLIRAAIDATAPPSPLWLPTHSTPTNRNEQAYPDAPGSSPAP